MSNLYQQQLLQIQIALQSCENNEDRDNLISLRKDLEELISLENVESETDSDENNCEEENSKKVENF